MKKIVILLMIFILSGMLVSCDETNININNSNEIYYSEVVGEGKPKPDIALGYRIKKEQNFNDPIQIEILFGTVIVPSPNSVDTYTAELSAINQEYIKTLEEEYAFYDNPYTNNNRVVIKSFDDFCAANYGITKKGKALNSIIYEIPKSMFINKTGNIIFFLKANYLSNGKDLHYKIVDDKIMFSTRKMD